MIGAFFFQAEHRWQYPQIYLDTQCQMAVYANWSKGEGWVAYDSYLDQVASMHRFPPLYPLALGGMHALTGNWIPAASILDVLFIWGFMLSLVYWVRELLDKTEQTVFWLFLWVGWVPFHYGTGSDLMALSLLSWGMWSGWRYLKSKRRSLFLWATLLVLAGMWVRPAYLPLGSIWVISFGSKWLTRGPNPYGELGISLMLYVLSASGLLYWQSLGPNLLPKGNGWYPTHLLSMTAFPIEAISFLPHLIGDQWGIPFSYWEGLKWILSAGIITVAAIATPVKWKESVFLPLVLINVAFLVYLSLTQPPETWNTFGFWTYVMEERYFLPVMWIVFFWLIQGVRQHRLLRLLVVSAWIYAMVIFSYLHLLPWIDPDQVDIPMAQERAIEQAHAWLIREEQQILPLYHPEHQYLLEALGWQQMHDTTEAKSVYYILKPQEEVGHVFSPVWQGFTLEVRGQ